MSRGRPTTSKTEVRVFRHSCILLCCWFDAAARSSHEQSGVVCGQKLLVCPDVKIHRRVTVPNPVAGKIDYEAELRRSNLLLLKSEFFSVVIWLLLYNCLALAFKAAAARLIFVTCANQKKQPISRCSELKEVRFPLDTRHGMLDKSVAHHQKTQQLQHNKTHTRSTHN